MENFRYIEFKNDNKEQLLEDIRYEFPLISIFVELDKYREKIVPWHWHNEVELFYVESGEVLYYTTQGIISFPKGTAGFINSNVLHKTRANGGNEDTNQRIHIFNSVLIGGRQGSDIYRKYISPFSSSAINVIKLTSDIKKENLIIEKIKKSFTIKRDEKFYEIKLKNALSEIWCDLLELKENEISINNTKDKNAERIKGIMIYIHEHYSEKISVSDISEKFFISDRNCYRIFRDNLNTTPQEYIRNYRIQKACELLANSKSSIAEIGYKCGLGSSSYFGKVFKDIMDSTPMEYRKKWQNNNKDGQK